MSMYLVNQMKPDCPLFPILISGGVTKLKHTVCTGSERSTEDNMDDGGELLPRTNASHAEIWWLLLEGTGIIFTATCKTII